MADQEDSAAGAATNTVGHVDNSWEHCPLAPRLIQSSVTAMPTRE